MMGQLVKKYALQRLESMYPGVYRGQCCTPATHIIRTSRVHAVRAVSMPDPRLDPAVCRRTSGGIVIIQRAHDTVIPEKFSLSLVTVEEANINGSPTSTKLILKMKRPNIPGNTDKEMVQLNFLRRERLQRPQLVCRASNLYELFHSSWALGIIKELLARCLRKI